MSTPAVVRDAVAQAKAALLALMADVSHEAYSGQNDAGAPTYATAVDRVAVVEIGPKTIRRADGSEVAALAKLTFVEQVTVGNRDRFTIGTMTGSVEMTKGTLDPTTGIPYVLEVWIV